MQIEVFVRSLGHGLLQTGQDQEQTLEERGNGMLCHSLEGAVIFIFCSTLLLPGLAYKVGSNIKQVSRHRREAIMAKKQDTSGGQAGNKKQGRQTNRQTEH